MLSSRDRRKSVHECFPEGKRLVEGLFAPFYSNHCYSCVGSKALPPVMEPDFGFLNLPSPFQESCVSLYPPAVLQERAQVTPISLTH